ncbi:somatostatin receptor type 5 isoform X1 [Ictalurus punctatus]|uniref:Somatostatin receptor type 5 isoform X1 n=1 Tax=Ictalurus punctatus TaxID=7998 RepID=A0A2D0Q5J0_ICTPU|nr:somatostatin receptor type 5 isoform X1 [Ictalurus punctatus]
MESGELWSQVEDPLVGSFNTSDFRTGSPLASMVSRMTNNQSYGMSNQTEPFFSSSMVMTAVISVIVFIVGLIGNTLAIYVVLRYVKMKTVTNIYILNLAVADELYILSQPFMSTQNVLSYWPFGSFLCRVVMTTDSLNQFTSIFCLTVMSIDRYLAVVHPLRSSRWRRPRVAKAVSAAVWTTSFIVVLPVVIFSDVQDKFNSCNMSWPEPHTIWPVAFILYTSVLGFFAPLLVICVCYVLIVVRVKASGARTGLGRRRRSERKVTRMVVVIVVAFVLCWLPFYTVNIVNLIFHLPENSVMVGVYFFSVSLTYANSCANPVLYGFLSDNFRQSFRKVLCLRRANGVEDGEPSAPRTDKTSAFDGFLPVRNDHINGHAQTGQDMQLEPCSGQTSHPQPVKSKVIGQSSL